MTKKVILVWFRNDLRINDNEILFEAINKGDIVIPVYIFDSRYFGKNSYGFHYTGILRTKFLLESVEYLKSQLQALGADLLIFHGKPEEILSKVCAKYEVTQVYHHREVAFRETRISEKVEAALWKERINLKHFIGHTLYHKEDLPFPIKDVPESFAQFKKKIEKESFVRPIIPAIDHIITHPHLEQTNLPTLEELGFTPQEIAQSDSNSTPLQGGEEQGLYWLERTLSPSYDEINDYNYISPYIAHGNISPAYYYHKIKESLPTGKKKKYDNLINRLFWRDYFRFMLKKHPNIFFKDQEETKDFQQSTDRLLHLLKEGSDNDAINDLLNEMKQTGNLPYEYREILAAYMLQELGVHHLAGALVFEEYFIDYAPATVYGYWAHYADKGTSTKDSIQVPWRDLLKKHYCPRMVVK
ncbi:deoxyribodipyrimidine photo-lyase [Sphingobacterium wenxiniae]|uniref:Deoxyribodipyrimidine photo-lyase n=1 Tax=Sphingobacterium wenxiniae TaxID=683125 RepID=A0A1I6SZR7_9SPHI|nr:deoxyribodipyrimidine photo-lyase [Sphingobacterium wenxiniae]SFS82489.1 deoxyribodipyrimidine photo-lyase [Sphingobacterium wenxiniae]